MNVNESTIESTIEEEEEDGKVKVKEKDTVEMKPSTKVIILLSSVLGLFFTVWNHHIVDRKRKKKMERLRMVHEWRAEIYL